MKRWLKWQLTRLRWTRLGQYLKPPTYPTVGEWLGGSGGTFNPETMERRDKK